MELSVITEQDFMLFKVEGEVDMYAAPDLFTSYLDHSQRFPLLPVIVNIENTTYMDSSGIGTLFKMFSDSKARNVKFFVCGARGMVASLFELSRMNSILPRAENVRSAQSMIRSE